MGARFVIVVAMVVGVSARADAGQRGADVTFFGDVMPIVSAQCGACHRPGGSAPFSLGTYEDVRSRASLIADVVTRRVMPPWKPEPGYGGPFVGERRLSDEQIATLTRWVEQGAPAGEPVARAEPPPQSLDGWRLGVPDLVVSLPNPYVLQPGGADVFRNFAVPIQLPEARYVRGVEFRPSNPRASHHANLRIDRSGASRRLDERDPQPGYEGITAPGAAYPDGHFLGWTPGQAAPLLPDGMSWRLVPGSTLVVEMHLVPGVGPEPIAFSVGLYFTDVEPTRTPAMLRLGRQNIDIPPGQANYVSRDSYVLPVDVEIHTVQPHAHHLAKEIKGYAILPDGTRRWLLYIRQWDFHWQDVYRYVSPIGLPKGTTLHMEYTYDNSGLAGTHEAHLAGPQRVRWGQRTTDEMGDLWIQVLTRTPEDLALLTRSFGAKQFAEDIVGYRMMLERSPEDARIHSSIADAYLRLGRIDDATRHLIEHVRLEPDSASAHYNLATVLAGAGRATEAAAHFTRAIALDPADAIARNGLGHLFLGASRIDEALTLFREAVRIDPLYANAHNNLGVALEKRGMSAEALEAYQRATQIAPDNADAQYNLASAFRAAGRRDEAERAYQEALRAAPDYEPALFDLGLLREAGGDYPSAAALYRRALAVRAGEPTTMIRLAWVLATSPAGRGRDGAEAVALAERARRAMSQQDTPSLLDTLAAAYAAAGDFGRAISTAERAVERLRRLGSPPAVVSDVEARLALYRRRIAYEVGTFGQR